jgi:iron complex outermembrane recepter protein
MKDDLPRVVTPTPMRRAVLMFASACLALEGSGTSLHAEFTHDLGDLSLEELMAETVTSVSKREQKLSDAAAAVSLLVTNDLIRSGARSIPEALRLVPGMDVAAYNSNQWAVSMRGLNHLYANKLLVLIDGRAVYTPLFAGVYWDLQQRMLEDVERIEVIRGPGATVWGANAVNGVINIVSSSAKDTTGTLVLADAGTQGHQGGVRHGGQIGPSTFYRVFASGQETESYSLLDGTDAGDGWHNTHAGFRVDHYGENRSHLTWQSDLTLVNLHERTADGYNLNTIGRWTREWADRSTVEAQVYVDRTHRNEVARSRNTVDTYDFTLQSTFGLGDRHDLVGGIGYRHIASRLEQTNSYSIIRDGVFDLKVFSAFLQDEIKLVPDVVKLTVGTKLEHNDFTGFEVQPSIRATVKPAHNQTVWAAVSRAVRTPSAIEGWDLTALVLAGPMPGPDGRVYLPMLVGNRDLKAEELWAYELGYRYQPTRALNLDLAVFHNNYDNVITSGAFERFIPGVPVGSAEVPWTNAIAGETIRARSHGGEASVTVAPSPNWRLSASYSLLRFRMHLPEHEPKLIPVESYTDNSPQQQVTVRSSLNLTARTDLDLQARFVDQLATTPAYITADVRFAFRPIANVELSLIGKNLFDGQHPEQGEIVGSTMAQVPRSVWAKIALRF